MSSVGALNTALARHRVSANVISVSVGFADNAPAGVQESIVVPPGKSLCGTESLQVDSCDGECHKVPQEACWEKIQQAYRELETIANNKEVNE